MFMCKHCLQQYDDNELAYTLILESRMSVPAETVGMYLMKFCSLKHTQQFLENIRTQKLRYVLTKKGPNGDKQYEPAYPADLLLVIGSNAS